MAVDLKANQYLVRGSRGGTRETSMDANQVLLDPAGNALQNVVQAARAPSATDDLNSVFKISVGMRWFDTVAGILYECTNASASAAAWTKTVAGASDGSALGQTSADTVLHIYANSETGNDANAGTSADNAVATLQAVINLIPHNTRYWVVAHLEGTFADADIVFGGKHINTPFNYGNVLFDGGDELTIVDDNSGANYQATSVLAGSITLTGIGWTKNEHVGKIIEVVDGNAATAIRGILRNTEDTLYFIADFYVLPSAPPAFRFVEPKTVIGKSGASSHLRLQATGGGYYNVRFQRLTFSNSTIQLNSPSLSFVPCACVFRYTESYKHVIASSTLANTGTIYAAYYIADPTDPSTILTGTNRWFKVGSILAQDSGCLQHVQGSPQINLSYAAFSGYVKLRDCGIVRLPRFVESLELHQCSYNFNLSDKAEIDTYIADASANALTLKHCQIEFGKSALIIDNPTAHGIHIENSFIVFDEDISISDAGGNVVDIDGQSVVKFNGALLGADNVGFALNVGENTSVELNAADNTITATAGGVSFDGTNAYATVADIEGGTPAISLDTASRVRNATPIAVTAAE